MARTHTVKAARKKQPGCMSPECRKDSREINIGDSYQWFSIRSHRAGRGTRKVYHLGCPIPQSHRTTSAQLGTIYDAQEAAERSIANLNREEDAEAILDNLRSIATETAEAIRAAAAMYEEGADNIESGFGHSTYVSDELREKAQSVNDWADNIDNVDLDEYSGEEAEDFDEAEARRESEIEVAGVEFGIPTAVAQEHQDAGTLAEAVRNSVIAPDVWDADEGRVDPATVFVSLVDDDVERKQNEHDAEQDESDGKEEWIDEQVGKLEEVINESPL